MALTKKLSNLVVAGYLPMGRFMKILLDQLEFAPLFDAGANGDAKPASAYGSLD